MKMFTQFECESVCLLYLLFKLFGVVKVFKPVTSKAGNSEVYVICLYYNPHSDYEKVLMANYGTNITKRAMFKRADIPDEFISQIIDCATYFAGHQENTINKNVELFLNKMTYQHIKELKETKEAVAHEYLRRYDVEELKFGLLVGNDILRNAPSYNMDSKYELGSFTDHKNESRQDFPTKLNTLLKKTVNVEEYSDVFLEDTIWLQFYDTTVKDVVIKFGKPVINVNNSKFCSGHLLKALYETMQLLGNINANVNQTTSNSLLHSAIRMCDVSNQPWFSNQWLAQRISTNIILDILKTMTDNTSFLLNGLPLVTQYNVGLVYLLGTAFEEVGFANPAKVGCYSLLFKGLKRSCLDMINCEVFENVKHAIINNTDDAVFSYFPVSYLCNQYLFKVVVSTNHICLKAAITSKIQNVKSLLDQSVIDKIGAINF